MLAQTAGVVLALAAILVLLRPSPDRLPFSGRALRLLCSVIPFEIAGPLFAVPALWRHNRDIPLRRLLDIPPLPPPRLRAIVLRNLRILAALLPAIQLLNLLTAWLLRRLGYGELPRQQALDPECLASLPYCLLLVFSTVFLAPIGEELVFRHLCCNGLRTLLRTPLPQIATAAAFALAHCLPQALPSLFLLAIVLQKRKDEDGLPASILLHAFYNLAVLVLLLAGGLLRRLP